MKTVVFGAGGMVGSAITSLLLRAKSISDDVYAPGRNDLDLRQPEAVEVYMAEIRPQRIFLAAARVGGIYANESAPADFILDNLKIQTNVISAAFAAGVKELLFLGSSCIYPRDSIQPIVEEALLSGPLELTNEPYAIAKIAGIKLCESLNRQYAGTHGLDYRCLMPTNLYGPGDNYHPQNSHVVPALIRRFHDAKKAGEGRVMVWGSGNPRREFLYVDDLARACIDIMDVQKPKFEQVVTPRCSHINIGFGSDISIRDLAVVISEVVGFNGEIYFDKSRPDGTPRKLLDSSRAIRLGWAPRTSLREGLELTYQDYIRRYG